MMRTCDTLPEDTGRYKSEVSGNIGSLASNHCSCLLIEFGSCVAIKNTVPLVKVILLNLVTKRNYLTPVYQIFLFKFSLGAAGSQVTQFRLMTC